MSRPCQPIMTTPYGAEPSRESVQRRPGPSVVEFGTNWCGFCRMAQPVIEQGFAAYQHVPRVKVEDGPGQPLGRAFRVKLWPTLIFLKDGAEVARVVRPQDAAAIADALRAITT